MLVEPESRTGAKLNVLCAEDNAFERSAIAELFRSTNETYLANGTPMQFEVHLVPSIDAVLAALSTAHEPFSIVMLDVNLGSDESSETIIGLVREEVGERVPIVLFSATAHIGCAQPPYLIEPIGWLLLCILGLQAGLTDAWGLDLPAHRCM